MRSVSRHLGLGSLIVLALVLLGAAVVLAQSAPRVSRFGCMSSTAACWSAASRRRTG